MKAAIKKRIEVIRRGEVPEGYKKIKGIGVIPNDWETGKLADVLHQEARPVPKPKKPYWRLGLLSHAKGTFHELVENPDSVFMEELFLVKRDDLIVNITFAWEHAIALAKEDDEGMLVSHRFPTYVFNDKRSPQFYNAIVMQKWFKELLVNISPGGAGRNRVMNKSAFLKLPCYIPSYSEQQNIAKIITACDKVIQLKEKLIEEKRRQKKWLMENLLDPNSGVRLPGFSGEWGKEKIGSITKLTTGATPATQISENWNGDILWMNSGELNLKYINDVEGRITQIGYESSSTKTIPKHCVLIGLAGQGKTRGTAAINLIPLCTNQSIAAIWPNKIIDPHYLYHYLDNQYEALRALSSGDGIRGGLNLELIRSFFIEFPTSVKEQCKIGKILTDCDNVISIHNKELEQGKLKKKGLMQVLLTGIVRV